MTHSADLAFYELVRERELVPEKRLQEAMLAAERDRVPLERVLIQSGLLAASVCEHLLQLRNRRALLCQSCGGYTYVLTEQEGDVYCEHCGRLLRMAERNPLDVTPVPPSRSGPPRGPATRSGRRQPRRPPPQPMRSVPPAPLRGPTSRQARETADSGHAMRPRRRGAGVPPPRPAPRPAPTPANTELFLKRMLGRLEDGDDPLVERLIESAGAALARTVEERYLSGLEQRIADEVTGRVVEVFTRGEVQLPRVTQVAVERAQEQAENLLMGLREELASGRASRDEEQHARLEDLKAEVDELRGALRSDEVRLDAAAGAELQELIAERLAGPLPEGLEQGLRAHATEAAEEALSARLGLPAGTPETWRESLARETLDLLRAELAERGLEALPPRVTADVVAHAEAMAERSDTTSDMGRVEGELADERMQLVAARTLETLWEHLEEHGAAGLPARVLEDLTDRDGLTAHVLESIWGHLEEHGLAGFPERIQADVASVAGSGGGEGQAAGSDVAAGVLASIWGHLEEHGLAGFPERIQSDARQLGLDAVADLEARVSRVEARLGMEDVGGAGLAARVTRIEARLASGGGAGEPDFASEEFMEQVVNLALERVAEADTERRVSLLSSQIWPRIRAQLDEQLQDWEPTGWTDALRDLAQAAVDEVIGGLDLAGLPERVARYAVEQVRGRGHASEEAREAAEAAVERAVAKIDYETLAQRVALEATRPLMQAIDGRLAGLPQQVIEQTTERVLAELQTRPE
ncbi:MAG: hypothetical protein R3F62_21230 [Planctomycetota bacterium]